VSLTGPLYQRKDYMRLVLQPDKIVLEDVRSKYMSKTIFFYEFIWDTPTANPQVELLEARLKASMPELSFSVVINSLKTRTVASQRTPKSVSFKYRHTAEVEVTRA
jgi:hypothetical protein